MHGWGRWAGKRRWQIAALVASALLFAAFRGADPFRKPKTIYEADVGCGVVTDRIRGQDVFLELPRGTPKGVAFFAHGCDHSGGDLYPPSPRCPSCLGLAEEQRLRKAVLSRRIALISISSLDRNGTKCWHELKNDGGENVATIIKAVIVRQGLLRLPFYVIGASSGGSMALNMPRLLNAKGVYVQVRGVDNDMLTLPNKRKYPPTAFVHMPEDTRNGALIGANINFLRQAGVPVLEVRVYPRPVTVEFLTSRSPPVTKKIAADVITALTDYGLLDEDGYVLRAPRPKMANWAPVAKPFVGNLSLVRDQSDIGELVNLAYGHHELVSDEAEAVLAWLQGGGKGDLAQAQKRAKADWATWERRLRSERCEGVSRRG